MNSIIKKEPLDETGSINPNDTCENCKNLSRSIDSLKESVNILYRNVKRYKSIMSAFVEIDVTTKLMRKETAVTVPTTTDLPKTVDSFKSELPTTDMLLTDFPVTCEQMLQHLEEKIGPETNEVYVSAMSTLWRDCVMKNLENILDVKIVLAYNLDGTHGKLRLKEYTNFYQALIDSIRRLPYLKQRDPETVLRQAMQYCKKKMFKKKSARKHRKSYVH